MSRTAILLLALALAGTAAVYWVLSDARQSATVTATAPDPGSPIVAVTVPALDGNTALGAQIFNAKCAACHGENAAGSHGNGPPLVHKIYEPGHHGDAAFLLAVQNGVTAHHWRFGNMAPVEGLTRGDVASIVAYVRTLQRANGIN
jgi:mono/diheme cytochrome c family protein